MRKMDPIPEPDGEGQAWLENLSVALQAHATVGSQAETVAGLAQASLPVELQQEADGSLSHASFARVSLSAATFTSLPATACQCSCSKRRTILSVKPLLPGSVFRLHLLR